MRPTSEKNPKRRNQRLRKNVRSTSDIALQNQVHHNPMITLQEQIRPVTITKEISYIGESINLYLRCGYIENGNYVGGIGSTNVYFK